MSNISTLPRHDWGWLYLIQCGERYKIGHTTNPKRRIREFSQQLPYPVKFIAAIHVPDPRDYEREMHRAFRRWHGHNEWFELGPVQLEAAIEDFEIGSEDNGWIMERGAP